MSLARSSSGRAGGFSAKRVFGSIVRWYTDRCGGSNASAASRSCCSCCRLWPGSAYIKSRLKRSNDSRASCAAARAWLAVVHAADALEQRVVETLHADRQPVDARLRKRPKTLALEGAGVGLERDLAGRLQRQQAAHARQQGVDAVGRKQARRAATDEHADDRSAPHQRQRRLEVGPQGLQVTRFGQSGCGDLMRVEIAIRAFGQAPRQVHVQRQRRQRRELQRAGPQVVLDGRAREPAGAGPPQAAEPPRGQRAQ